MLEPSARTRPLIMARADAPFGTKKDMPKAQDFHNRGADRIEQGQVSAAVLEYQKALSLDPDSLDTRIDLAWALIVLGRYAEARRELDHVLRKDPLHARAHRNLGVLYAKQGNNLLAEKELLESVRLDPTDANTFYNLAVLYFLTGKKDLAKNTLKTAASLDPLDARVRSLLKKLLAK
ncbi:MAG: tetratricopeptide repeat protein [Candidatus Margulisbacteria bacterium]|nr:tetratricopeptide repeat protein [Candidatus Margulisiibacteriota bacterium]